MAENVKEGCKYEYIAKLMLGAHDKLFAEQNGTRATLLSCFPRVCGDFCVRILPREPKI